MPKATRLWPYKRKLLQPTVFWLSLGHLCFGIKFCREQMNLNTKAWSRISCRKILKNRSNIPWSQLAFATDVVICELSKLLMDCFCSKRSARWDALFSCWNKEQYFFWYPGLSWTHLSINVLLLCCGSDLFCPPGCRCCSIFFTARLLNM